MGAWRWYVAAATTPQAISDRLAECPAEFREEVRARVQRQAEDAARMRANK
jgi:ribose 1,5-bisphosphokinase PhnN